VILIALFVVFSFGFLAVINDTAAIGYALAAERGKMEKLQGTVEQQEIDLASAQSWTTLESKVSALGFVERGGLAYVRSTGLSTVATALPDISR
jgi:hypothetical protein